MAQCSPRSRTHRLTARATTCSLSTTVCAPDGWRERAALVLGDHMNTDVWIERIRQFAQERDWEQFHTPKNLAMALSVEASELVEIFQWLTPEQATEVMQGEKARAVEDEVADILSYLLRLVDVLEIDLEEALEHKSADNARRYTVRRSRGSSDKAGH